MSEAAVAQAELALAKSLGSLEAQVRELIHDNNTRTQRDESVARSLAKLEEIPKQLEGIKEEFKSMSDKMDERLKALERDQIRRDQTASLGVLLIKSPAFGWVLGIVLAAAAYLWGRSQ